MLNSVEDGARALLKDAAAVLSQFPQIEHIVIGGWCPVIRNKSRILHPGTLDVGILFRYSNKPGFLSDVIERLIQSGFAPSAKHSFQLLKKQVVNGKTLIYNIDLLHPRMLEDKDSMGLFVDHLELDIPLNNAERQLKKMCSVVLPNSEVLFQKSMYTAVSIDGQSLPLVTFEGMFVTKMDSCQKQKRERDSFDIYLAFANDGVNAQSINQLASEDNRIDDSLKEFKLHLQNKADEFNKNVKHFCKGIEDSPAQYVLAKLNG
ncbi:hypothetical protein [Acidithiobacillus concretivorus]|uniref:Nucleotidyl transferase AbiEii/AbiGii toxin family protein n=1 Tax=Acidithiobacillus concretivorus TaxID=3063952 RepID=A0ABS5ZRV9_9PROT|nr:hypothetical protein [Acidithiobacillus concretivorus]MBU2739375.1 hypothetical protein [Acidithiobacillus concretivorus]